MSVRIFRSSRVRSQRSEKQLAKQVTGRVTPASGALPNPFLKADVRSSSCVFEDKTTLKDSFPVKVALWHKLRAQAFPSRKTPVLSINFETVGLRLFVLDSATFAKIRKHL